MSDCWGVWLHATTTGVPHRLCCTHRLFDTRHKSWTLKTHDQVENRKSLSLLWHLIIIISICKAQNLVRRDYSKRRHARMHARTHAHTHTHARTHARTHTHAREREHTDYIQSLIYTHNLKQAANRDLRRMKTAARNGKRGYSFWKRKILRFYVNEPRKGFCRRGRGRSLLVGGPKTEKCWTCLLWPSSANWYSGKSIVNWK